MPFYCLGRGFAQSEQELAADDPGVGEVCVGPSPESDSGFLLLVGEDLAVGEAGVVVDRVVQETHAGTCPVLAARLPAKDLVATAVGDVAESLETIGVVPEMGGEWEADYRARIRGMPVRTAVDDLHDEIREIAATRGRMQSVRTLRQRLAMLSPAQALDYVNALLGGEAPPQLVAVGVEQLVEPIDPVLAVETLRQGGPHQTA